MPSRCATPIVLLFTLASKLCIIMLGKDSDFNQACKQRERNDNYNHYPLVGTSASRKSGSPVVVVVVVVVELGTINNCTHLMMPS